MRGDLVALLFLLGVGLNACSDHKRAENRATPSQPAPDPSATGSAAAPASRPIDAAPPPIDAPPPLPQRKVTTGLGPYPNLDAYCREVIDKEPDVPTHCNPAKGPRRRLAPVAPYRDVRLFYLGYPDGDSLEVAFETDAGWFVVDGLFWIRKVGRLTGKSRLDEVKFEDVFPGGAPELILRWTFRGTWESEFPTEKRTLRTLTVCGLGASGKPGCSDLPETILHRYSPRKPITDLRYDIEFEPGGVVVISDRPGHEQLDQNQAGLSGESPHRLQLTFP